MNEKKMLRVVAAGTASVPNYERQEAPINAQRSFIGRRFVETSPGVYGFEPTHVIHEVPNRKEYVDALVAGDLAPADQQTADAVGIEFKKTEELVDALAAQDREAADQKALEVGTGPTGAQASSAQPQGGEVTLPAAAGATGTEGSLGDPTAALVPDGLNTFLDTPDAKKDAKASKGGR